MEAVMLFAWDSLCIFCRALFGGLIAVVIIAALHFLSKMMFQPAPYNKLKSRSSYRVGGKRYGG